MHEMYGTAQEAYGSSKYSWNLEGHVIVSLSPSLLTNS